jgi:chromosome segregation ATPase
MNEHIKSLHSSYVAHITSLISQIQYLSSNLQSTTTLLLTTLYELKSVYIENSKLKNTINKVQEEIKDNKIQEIEVLNKLIKNASSQRTSDNKLKTSKGADNANQTEIAKENSSIISISEHAAALQRRVYVLRDQNSKLELSIHNATQNYLEAKQLLESKSLYLLLNFKANKLQGSMDSSNSDKLRVLNYALLQHPSESISGIYDF